MRYWDNILAVLQAAETSFIPGNVGKLIFESPDETHEVLIEVKENIG
ncbi:MAG: hypothetical protein GY817_03650 [bacterium]|nr:hypothetical protein [bacterium]